MLCVVCCVLFDVCCFCYMVLFGVVAVVCGFVVCCLVPLTFVCCSVFVGCRSLFVCVFVCLWLLFVV